MIQLTLSPNDVKLLIRSLKFSKRKVEQDYESNTYARETTQDKAGIEILNNYIQGEAITIRRINAMIARLTKTANMVPEKEFRKGKVAQDVSNGIVYSQAKRENNAMPYTIQKKDSGKVIFQ